MIRYCTKTPRYGTNDCYYSNIKSSMKIAEMYAFWDDEIYMIDLEEATDVGEDTYWGWMDNDGDISMVYPLRKLMNMCFPYGADAEENAGRGRVIRVSITEIRKMRG